MHTFFSSIVSLTCLKTKLSRAEVSRRQCRLIHWLLSMSWFRLACSSCTCHLIGFGTGILPFECSRPSFTYFSYLTSFWPLCHSFPRLWGQRLTRNSHTGYVTSTCTISGLLLTRFKKVTSDWLLCRVIGWHHVLVYMQHLAPKDERISSSAGLDYWERW